MKPLDKILNLLKEHGRAENVVNSLSEEELKRMNIGIRSKGTSISLYPLPTSSNEDRIRKTLSGCKGYLNARDRQLLEQMLDTSMPFSSADITRMWNRKEDFQVAQIPPIFTKDYENFTRSMKIDGVETKRFPTLDYIFNVFEDKGTTFAGSPSTRRTTPKDVTNFIVKAFRWDKLDSYVKKEIGLILENEDFDYKSDETKEQVMLKTKEALDHIDDSLGSLAANAKRNYKSIPKVLDKSKLEKIMSKKFWHTEFSEADVNTVKNAYANLVHQYAFDRKLGELNGNVRSQAQKIFPEIEQAIVNGTELYKDMHSKRVPVDLSGVDSDLLFKGTKKEIESLVGYCGSNVSVERLKRLKETSANQVLDAYRENHGIIKGPGKTSNQIRELFYDHIKSLGEQTGQAALPDISKELKVPIEVVKRAYDK